MDRIKRFIWAALEQEVPADHPLMGACTELINAANTHIDAGLQSGDKDIWAMFDTDPFVVDGPHRDEKIYFITVNMQAYPETKGESDPSAFKDAMGRLNRIWPWFVRIMMLQCQTMLPRFPGIAVEDASDLPDQIFHLVVKHESG